MIRLRFLKGCAPYNRGEVAGFDDVHANRLIADGFAVDVDAAVEAGSDADADAGADGPGPVDAAAGDSKAAKAGKA